MEGQQHEPLPGFACSTLSVWIGHRDYHDASPEALQDRLASIDRQLLALNCTEEFCQEFTLNGGGVCERMAGRRCTKHRGCRGPLPAGKICSLEFVQRVLELRKQVDPRWSRKNVFLQ